MTKIFIFCSWDTCSHFPKQLSPQPSINDLWMAYLERIPEDCTNDEIDALQSWFYQEVEDRCYELLLL